MTGLKKKNRDKIVLQQKLLVPAILDENGEIITMKKKIEEAVDGSLQSLKRTTDLYQLHWLKDKQIFWEA